ncbi:hypothetical protein MCUN1_003322 [Malassezia cuniculi]|uniref:Protein YIP n=1 Tax=Malassezia cuniculi TaxID=948313 RepID=A0AAF0F1B9_9BASI|nr:hypothetical protein MCUN1_003322 [Malassezia cuniculi]
MSEWLSAFGTGGLPGEPSLMEDAHMMDDTDLAGPLIYCFIFGMILLLAGKSQFGYVYGVGLMGVILIYLLLNLMSEGGIDASRVSSVLGYCLLPLCLLSAINVFVRLDGWFGSIISPLFILWCSTSASGIFVSILGMHNQRVLVAYPVGLFYACFALLSVFDVGAK